VEKGNRDFEKKLAGVRAKTATNLGKREVIVEGHLVNCHCLGESDPAKGETAYSPKVSPSSWASLQ